MTEQGTRHFRKLLPGDIAPSSGQYREVHGQKLDGREVTVTKGEPLPPASQPGASYELVDPARAKGADSDPMH